MFHVKQPKNKGLFHVKHAKIKRTKKFNYIFVELMSKNACAIGKKQEKTPKNGVFI